MTIALTTAVSSLALVALAGLTVERRPAVAQAGSLAEVLAAAAEQVRGHARDWQSVVLEENYLQIVRDVPLVSRRTRADMILFDITGDGLWAPFRDVFEVDGQGVRRRDDRLVRLFQGITAPDARAQALAISEESARFNLGGFGITAPRTINTPMTALLFLLAANQARSTFSPAGQDEVDGVECLVVSFVEHGRPSLIASSDGTVQVRGRFWLERDTARLRRSELIAVTTRDGDSTRFVRATVTTTFGEDARLRLWLPFRMDEHYDINRGFARGTIDGQAVYGNARQFAVTTFEQVP